MPVFAFQRKQKKDSLQNYYADPNYCKHCGEMIRVKDNERPAETRCRHFCNKSCAASYNNKKRIRKNVTKTGNCQECGLEIEYKHRKDGGYSKRLYCDLCLKNLRSEKARKSDSLKRVRVCQKSTIIDPCERCGVMIEKKTYNGISYRHFCESCLTEVKSENSRRSAIQQGQNGLPKPLYEMTKGELRKHHPSYHYFKIQIDKDARALYKRSGQPYVCKACGYSHHVQICHIREIKDFPDSALISEINAITNLAALCPNHHWELDHGILKL